jgi:hypothetical protein
MNLTKNQIYIISSVIIIAVVYFMFFRKKKTPNVAAKMVTPPPANTETDPNPGESGYYGNQFGWNAGTNPLYTSFNQAMGSVDGNMSNSVAGIMESNYNAGFKTKNVTPVERKCPAGQYPCYNTPGECCTPYYKTKNVTPVERKCPAGQYPCYNTPGECCTPYYKTAAPGFNRADSSYAANAVNESNYMPWQVPMPGTSNPSKSWETN